MFNLKLIPLEERIVLDAAAAAVIYVNLHAHGADNGTSWANAFTTLQGALAKAATTTSPEQIWVAEGTYTPGGGPSSTFTLSNNESLYGGFLSGMTSLSQRNPTANPTILSGDNSNNDLAGNPLTDTNSTFLASKADNSLNVITANNVTATLDGFTIKDAYDPIVSTSTIGGGISGSNDHLTLNNIVFTDNFALGVAENGGAGGGGAIGLVSSTLTVTNSVFSQNYGGYAGGGIMAISSQVTLSNDLFTNNQAIFDGGAAYLINSNVSISHTSFISNSSIESDTGALGDTNSGSLNVSLTISYSEFLDNSSNPSLYNDIGAGAINVTNFGLFSGGSSTVNISYTDFNGNTCGTQTVGGAINIGLGATFTITNSTFENNSAFAGGAIVLPNPYFAPPSGPATPPLTIENCVFTNNSATDVGGAIYDDAGSLVNIIGSTFIGNKAGSSGGAIQIDDIEPIFGGQLTIAKDVNITNSIFLGNSAPQGGAVAFVDHLDLSTLSLTNNIFILNSASSGVDLYQSGGTSTVTGNLFLELPNAGGLVAIDVGPSTVNGNTTSAAIVNSLVQNNLLLFSNDIALL